MGGGTAASRWIRALAFSVVLFSVVLLPGCGGESPGGASTAAPPSVGVWTVALEDVEITRSWAGALEPVQSVPLVAPTAGYLQEVRVSNGTRVSAGQLILGIRSPELEARREVAEARAAQSEAELDRWVELQTSGAAGAGEVAEARLRWFQAQEALAQVASLSEANAIRVPAQGVVSGLTLAPGSWIAAGTPLGHVEGTGGMGIRLTVPSWEAESFSEAEHFTAITEDGGRHPVARISVGPGPNPGTASVELQLSDGPASRRGVELRYARRVPALLVPWAAVASDGDRHWVARVQPGDPPQLVRTPVTLGRPFQGGVEVLDGLAPGDQVVRYEPRSHPDGRAITPVESGR